MIPEFRDWLSDTWSGVRWARRSTWTWVHAAVYLYEVEPGEDIDCKRCLRILRKRWLAAAAGKPMSMFEAVPSAMGSGQVPSPLGGGG